MTDGRKCPIHKEAYCTEPHPKDPTRQHGFCMSCRREAMQTASRFTSDAKLLQQFHDAQRTMGRPGARGGIQPIGGIDTGE